LAAQASIYTNLGKNDYLLGQAELAVENLAEGVQLSTAIGNRTLLATALFYLAESSCTADRKRGQSLYQQALQIAQQDNLQLIECEVLLGLARLLRHEHENAARQSSALALTLAETLGNPSLLARATAIHDELYR
jgi:hypothetical protein